MLTPDDTPLWSALTAIATQSLAAFYAPGHKGGQGVAPALRVWLGDRVFRADIPELPDFDNLFTPTGPLHEAQVLAALAFGAEESFFLVNGSTCGISAALLAVSTPEKSVLVPRNIHRSVVSGLVLSGDQPIYLAPVHHLDWDLAFGVTPRQIAAALEQHPDIGTVLVVSPSYHGVCADLTAIATIVHAHDAVLIVDEAHGAHLGFHEALPGGAIAAGADLVIQSTHKTLSALSQASMLHVQGSRIDRDRLRQALQLTQSTSPNSLLLASLDVARQQMATTGAALLTQTLTLAHRVRSQLTSASMRWLHPVDLGPDFQLDSTRLTVDVAALGLTGYAADEYLWGQHQVVAELPTLRQLAFILSIGNTEADGDRLIAALAALVHQRPSHSAINRPGIPPLLIPPLHRPPLTPRMACLGPSKTIAISEAIGYPSAAALCPYPPGIPVLLPGEVITADVIAYLQAVQAAGGIITGSADPTLATLEVVAPA
jgi:arginine/lysine/ornithine decarboxylase